MGPLSLCGAGNETANLQLNAGGDAQNPTALSAPTAHSEGKGKWAHRKQPVGC